MTNPPPPQNTPTIIERLAAYQTARQLRRDRAAYEAIDAALRGNRPPLPPAKP